MKRESKVQSRKSKSDRIDYEDEDEDDDENEDDLNPSPDTPLATRHFDLGPET